MEFIKYNIWLIFVVITFLYWEHVRAEKPVAKSMFIKITFIKFKFNCLIN